jgi:TRAP-type transport system periplasmic protein
MNSHKNRHYMQCYKKNIYAFFLITLFLTIISINKTYSQIIKLATVVPEGSQWHKALKEMAYEWRNISNGQIKIQIYAGGIAGDDPDIIRKMRIGQLQGAAIATSGIAYIYPDITALTFPHNIKTDDELKYIINKTSPYFEKEISKKGFKILCWSNAGWVYFFSKTPVITPNDLKRQKLFFWGSETLYIDLLKKSGFNPIQLSIPDLLPSLQTGLVTAFAATPQAALGFQWYPFTPNMCNLRWQPLPAAIVISNKAWKKIPLKIRPKLIKSAQKLREKFWTDVIKLDNKSIAVMEEHGLKVNTPPPEAIAKWEKLIKDVAYPIFVGHRFSKNVFLKIQTAQKEYRNSLKSKTPKQSSP